MTSLKVYEILKAAGIDNCRLEAKILIESLFGEYSDSGEYDDRILEEALSKRVSGYPLQYIIGKWWFWECEFEVNENCLIPRPDTEILVDKAIHMLPYGAKFADLCTGSGCIAVSVLHSRPDTCADAYDLFEQTAGIAVRNAERNNVSDRMCVYVGDVMSNVLLDGKKYDAIISNPPYIKRETIGTLGREVLCEPLAALDGGNDGLDFYRAIIDNFNGNLAENGFFLFEIGYDQANDIREIAEKRGYSCEIFKDFGGNNRVAVVM